MAKKRYKQAKKVFSIPLGAGGPGFESLHSDQLSLKNRLFRRFFCVNSSFFGVCLTTFQLWSERRNGGNNCGAENCENRKIPNPSLIGIAQVFSPQIRRKLEFSSIIPYNDSTVSLCATKAAVWVYSHAAFLIF